MTYAPTDNDLIFKAISGSTLYGLSGPDSDVDYRGCIVPPLKAILSPFKRFETKVSHDGDDEEIHSLEKIINLASQCNPNVIELLFVPDKYVVRTSPAWKVIQDNRDGFLSREAEFRFKGYAIGQIIKNDRHRRYLLNPPDHKPIREEFGLISGREIKKDQFIAFMAILDKNLFGQIECWQELTREQRSLLYEELAGLCAIYAENIGLTAPDKEDRYSVEIDEDLKLQKANYLGFSSDFIDVAKREKRYYSALGEYNAYEKWKATRNEKRAALEARFLYDSKHISHTLRLLHMALEIGGGKGVIPDRRGIDDDFLKSIKFDGAMKYEEIMSYVDDLKIKISNAFAVSSLPLHPDRDKIEDLYMIAITTHYGL